MDTKLSHVGFLNMSSDGIVSLIPVMTVKTMADLLYNQKLPVHYHIQSFDYVYWGEDWYLSLEYSYFGSGGGILCLHEHNGIQRQLNQELRKRWVQSLQKPDTES